MSDGEGKEYEIGYRRPPKATQFKPGQSGNPNGRRKRTPENQGTVVSEELHANLLLTVGDDARHIMAKKLIVEQLGAAALRGDTHAFKALLDLRAYAEKHGDVPPTRIRFDAIWRDFGL